MPTRKTHSPGGVPLHDMLRRSIFPESEIVRVTLFGLPIQFAASAHQFLHHSARELAIMLLLLVFEYIRLSASINHTSQALIKNILDQLYLLGNVTCSSWFYARTQSIERTHITVVGISVVLRYLHGLGLLQLGFFCNFIFPVVRIGFEMAHISNITNIPQIIA